jgi:hypothetical protein
MISLGSTWAQVEINFPVGEGKRKGENSDNFTLINYQISSLKKQLNKTENHFSPYPRSEGDINLYTRLKVAMSC